MAHESSHDSPSREPPGQSVDSESRATVVWNVFDPEADVVVSARNRPHWDQNGAVTFVTIRLADSMPRAVVARWLAEQDDWLKKHGLDSESRTTRSHDSPSRDAALAGAPRHVQRAFQKFKNQRWHENLDNCHGKCLLRQRRLANIVAESLLTFDGQRYDVERFVVMPNHVHMLVQMRPSWGLRKQCESWMRFTGRQIHSLNATSGEFWSEPFDHIVRNEAQFQYLQEYIVDNPAKARLAESDYLLWIRGVGFITSHDSPSRELSEHCLDSESRELSEHCLDSESRELSEHCLDSESRELSEHCLDSPSRELSEHCLDSESRATNRHGRDSESRATVDHHSSKGDV